LSLPFLGCSVTSKMQGIVQKIVEKAQELMMRDEVIEYVGVKKKGRLYWYDNHQ
jgi:hypothetical protein